MGHVLFPTLDGIRSDLMHLDEFRHVPNERVSKYDPLDQWDCPVLCVQRAIHPSIRVYLKVNQSRPRGTLGGGGMNNRRQSAKSVELTIDQVTSDERPM